MSIAVLYLSWKAMLFNQINSIGAMPTSTKESVPPDARAQEGEALRRLIEGKKVTHQQLADEAQVGTKAYVSQLLSGHRPLNIEVATRLAAALGVRIDAFSPRLAALVRQAYEHVGRATYPALVDATLVETQAGEPRALSLNPESRQRARPVQWPFASLTPAEYSEISEGGRADLEQLARGMHMEARRTSKVSGG